MTAAATLSLVHTSPTTDAPIDVDTSTPGGAETDAQRAAREEREGREALARTYRTGVEIARSAFLADREQPAKVLASIARADGRTLGRKALRAAIMADLRDERRALGFKPRAK